MNADDTVHQEVAAEREEVHKPRVMQHLNCQVKRELEVMHILCRMEKSWSETWTSGRAIRSTAHNDVRIFLQRMGQAKMLKTQQLRWQEARGIGKRRSARAMAPWRAR